MIVIILLTLQDRGDFESFYSDTFAYIAFFRIKDALQV